MQFGFDSPVFSASEDPSLKLRRATLSSEIKAPVITAVRHESTGVLWIGTQTGLYRFIGKSHEVFASSAPDRLQLPASDIRGVVESSRNRIFVATYGGGVLEWNAASQTFYTAFSAYEFSEEDRYVVGIYADSEDNLWINTLSGLKVINIDTHEEPGWLIKENMPVLDQTAAQILETAPGTIFVGAEEKLYRFDLSSGIVSEVAWGTQPAKITSLASSSKATLLVGGDNGHIYGVDSGGNGLIRTRHILDNSGAPVTSLALFRSRLWIGTSTGLFSLNTELEELDSYNSSGSALFHNHVTTFAEVGEELFIGTYQGLNSIGRTAFSNRDSDNSGVYDDVMSFETDSSGSLWVGTFGGLFFSEDGNRTHGHVNISLEGSLSSESRVMSLEVAGDSLWIGTWNSGVRILNLDTKTIDEANISELEGSAVTKIMADIEGSIWIATFDRGLWRVSGGSSRTYGQMIGSPVTGLAQHGVDSLVAFTERDVYEFKRLEDKFSKISINPPASDVHVTIFAVTILNQDRILIGTKDHGVLLLERNSASSNFSTSQFATDEGLNNTSVYSIVSDGDGQFWSSTNNGIFRLDNAGKVVQRYGMSQGMKGVDFNFGAHFKSEDGSIYFGGTKGYVFFDPKRVSLENKKPEIALSQVQVDDNFIVGFDELKTLKSIDLSSDRNKLSLTLSVLDYEDPFHNRFQHKLQGFDPDWIDNGTNNKATYTSLPAGEYTFLARGANAAGVWSNESASLRVVVLPPWWLTRWAYAFYALCALFLVWGGLRVYRTQLLRQEAERRAEEMHALADTVRDELQESHELQDGLVQSAYQHNAATIDLIKQITCAADAANGDTSLSGHLAALEVLERSYYFQNATLSANLHEYVDGLCSLLLPGASVDPATVTTINLATASLVPAPIATPVAILLYELLDNALKHAFAQASVANFVQVSIDVEQSVTAAADVLVVTVQDNGTGLPAELSFDSAATRGFTVVRALCERLQGATDIGMGPGTCITLSLPMTQEPT